MAAFSSVVAYLLYYYALARMPASGVSAMLYLQPVVATLMAIPLLAEPVNPGLLVGGSLALAGSRFCPTTSPQSRALSASGRSCARGQHEGGGMTVGLISSVMLAMIGPAMRFRIRPLELF